MLVTPCNQANVMSDKEYYVISETYQPLQLLSLVPLSNARALFQIPLLTGSPHFPTAPLDGSVGVWHNQLKLLSHSSPFTIKQHAF